MIGIPVLISAFVSTGFCLGKEGDFRIFYRFAVKCVDMEVFLVIQ